MSRKPRRTTSKDKQRRFCFPVSPPASWQNSALRGPSLGPGPLLPRRTVGAATPRPQAPGHCLRDRLAAQLMRAPGHRHTWGCKAGREGTSSVRPARPRGLEERRVLRLLPQCRGTTGRGHSIVSPDGRAGEPHVHRAHLPGSRVSNWAGAKYHHKSERRWLLLPAHRQQSRATRNTENREP